MRNRKTEILFTLAVAALLAGGSLCYTNAQSAQNNPPGDPRLDKIIEQNNMILKNQEMFREEVQKIQRDLLQLRRRSS